MVDEIVGPRWYLFEEKKAGSVSCPAVFDG